MRTMPIFSIQPLIIFRFDASLCFDPLHALCNDQTGLGRMCIVFVMFYYDEKERVKKNSEQKKGRGQMEVSCCRLKNKTGGTGGLFMLGTG